MGALKFLTAMGLFTGHQKRVDLRQASRFSMRLIMKG